MSTNENVNKQDPLAAGYYLPGLPHILLAPHKYPAWQKVNAAFQKVKEEIENIQPDLLIIYSTYWASVLGHQIQARPNPEWIHVDDQFHALGEIPYKFKMDAEFAHAFKDECQSKGLHARTVNYHGFPIDTGTVVALKLLNPENKIPAVVVSSNVYSDRSETLILGKSARRTVEKMNKKAVAICISSLSNRLLENSEDNSEKIYSKKDEEWNQKVLEFFQDGRLEDLSQLSRQFHKEARVKKVNNFKPMWFMASLMGEHNNYEGVVHEYQPMLGTGAAVVGLTPSVSKANQLEFDESSPDVFDGEKDVLGELEFPERQNMGRSHLSEFDEGKGAFS